jgi:hypothetical protein
MRLENGYCPVAGCCEHKMNFCVSQNVGNILISGAIISRGRTLLQEVSYLNMGEEPARDVSSVLNRPKAQTMDNGKCNVGVINHPLSKTFIESL